MQRDVIKSEMKGKLRRNLLMKNVETQVKFEYKMYAKKFKAVEG